jgi:hypothetical protein
MDVSKPPRTIFSKYWDLFIDKFLLGTGFFGGGDGGREHVRMVEPSQYCKVELILHSRMAYITLESKIVITLHYCSGARLQLKLSLCLTN